MAEFELKFTEEDKYDTKEAESLVGTMITLGNHDKMLVKEHVHYHFLMVREDGSFHMRHAKFVLEEIAKKRKNKDRYSKLRKLFDGYVLMDTKWGSMGHLEYCANLVGDDSGVGPMIDNRSLIFDFNGTDGDGRFGTQIAGFSPTGTILPRLDTADFVRIPVNEIVEHALNRFKTRFEELLALKEKVFYTKTEKGGHFKITFWNEGGKYAYLMEGFFHEDGWQKDYFTIDRGLVKTAPTEQNSGVAQSGRRASWGKKITMPKNAVLVDKSVLLEPVYEFMKEKINILFNAKKDYE